MRSRCDSGAAVVCLGRVGPEVVFRNRIGQNQHIRQGRRHDGSKAGPLSVQAYDMLLRITRSYSAARVETGDGKQCRKAGGGAEKGSARHRSLWVSRFGRIRRDEFREGIGARQYVEGRLWRVVGDGFHEKRTALTAILKQQSQKSARSRDRRTARHAHRTSGKSRKMIVSAARSRTSTAS
jgi:hypothetical protein